MVLKKYVLANNKSVNGSGFDSMFNRALAKGVADGTFLQPKGKVSSHPPSFVLWERSSSIWCRFEIAFLSPDTYLDFYSPLFSYSEIRNRVTRLGY